MSNTPSRPGAPPAAGRTRHPAQGWRGHPRAHRLLPERRARQRARPAPHRPERHAGGEEDRRRARSPCRWTRCGSSSASTARRCRCRTSRAAPSPSASRTCWAGSRSTGTTAPEDLNRGRIFAQELMKYGRHEKAEKVLVQDRRPRRRRRGLARPRRGAARAEEARQGRGHAQGRAEPPQGLAVPEPAAREGAQGEGRPQGRARARRAGHPDRQQLRRRLGLPRQLA